MGLDTYFAHDLAAVSADTCAETDTDTADTDFTQDFGVIPTDSGTETDIFLLQVKLLLTLTLILICFAETEIVADTNTETNNPCCY